MKVLEPGSLNVKNYLIIVKGIFYNLLKIRCWP